MQIRLDEEKRKKRECNKMTTIDYKREYMSEEKIDRLLFNVYTQAV
jgi:hypothetical protein